MLVAGVYLLSMAGSWVVTDLGEALLSATRLLDEGSLDLAAPGASAPEVPWTVQSPGRPMRSRLAPLTPLTLAPLLAIDRLLGWDDPRPDGRLVHLQGVLACLGGLALMGAAVRRAGASPRAAGVAVAVTGLTWPVWRAARRAGPESLLVLLVCAFVAARTLEDVAPRRSRAVQWIVCGALPWTHPTGVFVAGALVLSVLLERNERSPVARLRHAAPHLLACAAGAASFMAIWNLGFHGDLLRGGYGLYGGASGFGQVPFLAGAANHVAALAPQVAPLVLLAAAGWWRGRSPIAAATAGPMLALVLLALFATFDQPEPERRLACAWPAFGAVLGRSFDGIDRRHAAPLSVGAAAALGLHFFMRDEGRYFQGLGGLFYPAVIWVELLVEGRPWWLVAVPVLALISVIWLAARRLAALPGATSDVELRRLP